MIAVAVSGWLEGNAPLFAESATLTHENSEIGIDTGRLDTVFFWTVDGVEHLVEQSLHYRTGDMTEELVVNNDNLDETDSVVGEDDRSLFVELKEDSDPDPGETSAFTITLDYELIGGLEDSGVSKFIQRINITNTQDSDTLNFTLFEYDDFDLDDSDDDDAVTITPSIAATGVDVTPFGDILDLLQDGEMDDFTLTSDDLGPGEDLEFAFQSDFVIEAGQSVELVKTQLIVPEPGTATLAIGLLATGLISNRRRA